MGYQDDIPQEDDPLSQSQEDILNNFIAISEGFNINHEGFNDDAKGSHKFLNMPQQEAAPSTTETEGALYTKNISGSPELFYREKSDGKEIQMTNSSTSDSIGHIVLPGGIVISWGKIVMGAGPSGIITPEGITTIYNIQFSVSLNVLNRFAWEEVSSKTFKIIRNSGDISTTVHWLVIGI